MRNHVVATFTAIQTVPNTCKLSLPNQLLINHPVGLQPARDMVASWIMVRPVDDTALRIRFILTIELNSVATLQSFDAASDVYVMGNQQGLTRCKSEDKTLMAAADVVVG